MYVGFELGFFKQESEQRSFSVHVSSMFLARIRTELWSDFTGEKLSLTWEGAASKRLSLGLVSAGVLIRKRRIGILGRILFLWLAVQREVQALNPAEYSIQFFGIVFLFILHSK